MQYWIRRFFLLENNSPSFFTIYSNFSSDIQYAKDKNNAYHREINSIYLHIVKDINTFDVVDNNYAKYKNGIYFHDNTISKDADLVRKFFSLKQE